MRPLLLAGLLLAAPAFGEAPGRPVLADLAWLAGSWCAVSEGASAEEVWLAPHGGVLLGLHRDVRAGGRAFFEYLRIEEEEDGAIVYYASPAGREATAFRLVESAGQRVVFANPEHDYPQRIIYERDGEELTATIEGEVAGETRSSAWRWTREACAEIAPVSSD